MPKSPEVEYVLPEVEESLPLWKTVRDCIAGQHAIKKAGIRYLPMPNPDDKSDENRLRYANYQARGVFVNFTGRTLSGMTGAVFGKDAVATLPEPLLPMYQNVDGGAVTLDQLAKQVLSDVISVGRCGLLTDYPTLTRPASRAEIAEGRIRPVVQFYFAEPMINWR